MEKSKSAQKIKLSSYEDIFKPDNATTQPERLPISALHPFKDHPFKQYSEEKMAEMIESVKQHGILMPILVRPLADGNSYEIVSGHNRVIAAREAGFTDIPATIREMDDDTSTIIMVDSNLRQRERLLPSEKAFAYKMKLEAIKRKAGRPTQDNSCQVGTNLLGVRSDKQVADNADESTRNIHRLIRLTSLIPPILDIVDDNGMAFNPAVAVSYLDHNQQTMLLNIMERDGSSPSLVQAERLKELSQKGELTDVTMESIMGELKPQQTQVVLKGSELTKYFPPGTSSEKISQTILKLLELWYKKQQEKQQPQEEQPLPPTHISHEMER
jgi:ParB family chromosome partitioning protein